MTTLIYRQRKNLLFYIWLLSLIFFIFNCILVIASVFYGIGSLGMVKILLGGAATGGLFVLFFSQNLFFLKKDDAMLILLILSLFAVTLVQVLTYPNLIDEQGRGSHSYIIGSTVYNISYILLGYVFVSRGGIKHSNKLSVVLQSLILLLILNNLNGNLVVDYQSLQDNISYKEISANHLLAGPYFYVLLIFSYSLAYGKWKIINFALSVMILFALGGRADLALFVLSVFFCELLKGISIPRVLFFLLISLPFFIIIFCMAYIIPSSNLAENNPLVQRMLLSGGMSSDASWSERIELLYMGLEGLKEQLAVGDVSYLIESRGGLGFYIHNILSVWQFYGFFVFVLIVCMLIQGFFRIKFLAKHTSGTMSTFLILMFLSTILGLIFAKSVTYVILWISIGCVWGRYYSCLKDTSITSQNLVIAK